MNHMNDPETVNDIDAVVLLKFDSAKRLEVNTGTPEKTASFLFKNVALQPLDLKEWDLPDWFNFNEPHWQRADSRGNWWIARGNIQNPTLSDWVKCTKRSNGGS